MNKANPLTSLIGSYGDSDDDSDDGVAITPKVTTVSPRGPPPMQPRAEPAMSSAPAPPNAAIHPAPITHCPWSACYDEGSGFTYYWNQNTNEVTWDAPREYLLALKVAQQHMQSAGSAEVSAEEWQLYQQVLAEKQAAVIQSKAPAKSVAVPLDKKKVDNNKNAKKQPPTFTSDDDEKIELITSYYNSDSDSNDESDSAVKSIAPSPSTKNKVSKHVSKHISKAALKPVPKPVPKTTNSEPKPKKKKKKEETAAAVPFGPSLPPNLAYTMPIGPELPPQMIIEPKAATEIKHEAMVEVKSENSTPKSNHTDELTDEKELLVQLKDKAKQLEQLGGELPTDLKKIIHDDCKSLNSSPGIVDMDVDNLLEEIEKKELPKLKSKSKIDIFEDDTPKSKETSVHNSPNSVRDKTPPKEERKPLFPSSIAIVEEEPVSLFPSSVNIRENGTEHKPTPVPEKIEKKSNVYIMDSNEPIEKVGRKKLRISNSVLPERKKPEPVSYTTKYSQHIEGFSSERKGLGFSKEEDETDSPKNVVSYGNGLSFTKGEVLNEEKPDDLLDDLMSLLEAKLSFLNQLQPCMVPPVAEMTIQMQTLRAAFTCGALTAAYWRRWLAAAEASLARLEECAAPAGWTCSFHRSSGRYQYRRLADGLEQWEFPISGPTDMDICTTPPHVPADQEPPPPLPSPPAVSPPPVPPPPCPVRPPTPPPPQWADHRPDPPPPGCDEPAPTTTPPLPPPPPLIKEPRRQEIGDELMSFYSEIGELEMITAKSSSPVRPSQSSPAPAPPVERERPDRKVEEKDKDGKSRKKTKVKISSSIGLKHKTVSSMVAKWQQVAEEINSD